MTCDDLAKQGDYISATPLHETADSCSKRVAAGGCARRNRSFVYTLSRRTRRDLGLRYNGGRLLDYICERVSIFMIDTLHKLQEFRPAIWPR